MSKLLYYIFLVVIMPAIGMERPHNYKPTAYAPAECSDLNFTDLERELIKITREDERPSTPKEILAQILSEKPLIEPLDHPKESISSFLSRYPQMIRHEQSLREMIKASTTSTDIDSVKEALNFYNKYYSSDWLSDIHEVAFHELTQKLGFNKKIFDIALNYKTPGALRWLSKQKIACQTIPVQKLVDLTLDARIAFHNCNESRTAALIQVLNATSFKQEAKETLFKALIASMSTIDSLKNKDDMQKIIVNRIHILGHAGYNLKEYENPLMPLALKSGFTPIISTLEHYGITNPNRPLLPFYLGEKPDNDNSVILEKIYANKNTGQSTEEFSVE